MSIDAPPLVIVLAVLVAAPILFVRMRRIARGQRLRIEWMWVRPVIVFATSPPPLIDWLWIGAALVPGAAFGWYRGGMVTVTIDPDTHELTSKASPAAMIFIVVLITVRLGLRYVAFAEEEAWHLDPVLITDASLAFVVGLGCVQRIEMALRAAAFCSKRAA